jgi:hypothetical protein
MATCRATRKDGERCRAEAQSGRDYCFFHDPAKGEERHDSKVAGGKAGKLATLATVKPWRGVAGEVDVLKAVTPVELVDLLCNTIDDVRTGAIDPKVANAVGYLAGVIVKIQEQEALVERLSAIEEALKARG